MPGPQRTLAGATHPVALDPAACLTVQRPGAACTACARTCPADTIRIDARTVTVDQHACTGCGRCAGACPTGALSVSGFASGRVIECSRVAPRDRMAGASIVPCLGGLSARHLRDRLPDGGAVLVDRGWCAACPAGGVAAPWAEAVGSVNADAETLARAERIVVRRAPISPRLAKAPPALAAGAPDRPARRQIFARLLGPSTGTRAPREAEARPPGRVAAPALARRTATLRDLAVGLPLPAALFPSIAFTGDANAARLAASLCPTGALALETGPDADRLTFEAAQCLACAACAEVPGVTAAVRGQGFYRGPVDLARLPMTGCRRCGTRFASDGAPDCPGCRKDHDLAAAGFALMRRRPDAGGI